MILTILHDGESLAVSSFVWRIQRVNVDCDRLFALFDVFKIQTYSTKHGNMGLLIDTSYVFRLNQAIKAEKLFLISQPVWLYHFQCRSRKTLLDAKAGGLKGELWRGLHGVLYDYDKKSQILNPERSQFRSTQLDNRTAPVRSILNGHLGAIYRINSLTIS